jgi:hypothetical protein
MTQNLDPKNKAINKSNDTSGDQLKTGSKKESAREELDSVPIDKDAQNYFDAQDENQELRRDDNWNIPL